MPYKSNMICLYLNSYCYISCNYQSIHETREGHFIDNINDLGHCHQSLVKVVPLCIIVTHESIGNYVPMRLSPL